MIEVNMAPKGQIFLLLIVLTVINFNLIKCDENDHVQLDEQMPEWERLYRNLINSSESPYEPEEIFNLLERIHKSFKKNGRNPSIEEHVDALLEFSRPIKYRCQADFFEELSRRINYERNVGTRKIGDSLIESERKQFELCKEIIEKELLRSLGKFDDKFDLEQAIQLRQSFGTSIPKIKKSSVFDDEATIAEGKVNFSKGLAAFIKSHDKPHKIRCCTKSIDEQEVIKRFKIHVEPLCQKVIKKLGFAMEVFKQVYNKTLIETINPNVLQWIETYHICEGALYSRFFDVTNSILKVF